MFTGTVAEIPVGTTGLAGSKNQSRIPPTALLIARNVTYENGTVQKEGGTTKYNSSAITGTPSILGGTDWNHDGATQRMIVVLDDGTIKKDDGGGTFATTLKSGLTATASTVPIFVSGGKEAAANNRKLFIITASNQVQVLSADGATTSDIATPPADWGSSYPAFGLTHEARFWGGGNSNDPHRLYYSTTTDHEDMTSAGSGSIAVYPGEGEKLVWAVSFRGFIICAKFPQGIYAVDTTSTTVANWKVKRLADGIGGVGPGTMTPAVDDVVFLDNAGEFRLLTAVDEFGDVGTSSLSDIQDVNSWIRDNLNTSQQAKWRMVYYATKREVHIACTGAGATTNDTRLVIDLNERLPRFRHSDRDTPISVWTREANGVPQLVNGDASGFVRLLDQDARSHDDTGYAGEFQTPHTDLSFLSPALATKRKNLKFLEMINEPKGNWNLAVDVIVDGTTTDTVQFNLGSSAAALGTFTLGTHALGEDSILNRRKRITGSGRRISLKCSNTGDGQDFSVAKFLLHFGVGDEREAS